MSGRHSEILTAADGITTALHYDEADDRLIVSNSADISGVLKENLAFRNDDLGRGKNMHKVASIPAHILAELEALWKANDIDPKDGLRAFLNDPDMLYFRTSTKKV